MASPYEILDRKRRGHELSGEEIDAVVLGATGDWEDSQLAAFLMAAAIHGLSGAETSALTRAMLDSGERWDLAREVGLLADKHSTGGVGDKASIVLAPLLAASGLPVAMLTGRGLGHTGGTADKLESIPGLRLDLSRDGMVRLLRGEGVAIGIATQEIAPADRRLYALRDVTGTVASEPLIAASILSKKLALGASGVVYDVKTGAGAFLEDEERSRALARLLVEISRDLGSAAIALVTDMSQPLGRWVGHTVEIQECLACLEGEGPADLRELVLALAVAEAELLGVGSIDARSLASTLDSGAAKELFLRWAAAQGAETEWCRRPSFPRAPIEEVVEADRDGWLLAVENRGLGLLLAEAGGGRRRAGQAVDHEIALRMEVRIGQRVEKGQVLCRTFLRAQDPDWRGRLERCFEIGEERPTVSPLIRERIVATAV